MCGRYAMGVRLSAVRYHLQQQGQQVDETADDDEVRETYNFAPGYYGAVYRAETPNQGAFVPGETDSHSQPVDSEEQGEQQQDRTKYKIQAMKWGLIPSWTKRSPNYGSLMKTINCRDDSLMEDRGMWVSMKKRKRCIVVCQGFYEWLKVGPSGKERVPHFIRRKDGELMCFAGLWDCVRYEDTDERLYTYTVITTSSNSDLKFLHDRMPVILDPGSKAMATWLDPHRTTWSKELQSLLKPYEGELEVYPVSKDVGKVGNNSPDFIIPVNSKENKKNIANFFANAGKKQQKNTLKKEEDAINTKESLKGQLCKPEVEDTASMGNLKRKHLHEEGKQDNDSQDPSKVAKVESFGEKSPLKKVPQMAQSPIKGGRKMHSATSNSASKTVTPAKAGHGNQRITNFFKK